LLSDDVIARWADLLVDYCLKVGKGETISIGSTPEAAPLVEAAGKAVILRGAHPLVRLEIPGLTEFFLEHADDAQLAHVPASTVAEAQEADGRIRIAAEEDTAAMQRVDPRRQAAFERSRDPIRRLARQKRWVLTQYPTAAYARAAGMPLGDYEAFVVRALFLDRPDPTGAWQELGRRQAGLVEFMSGVRSIRIEGEGTDLSLSVAGRTWINSDGRRNMPSGEIFTGPVEDSANGRLRCGFPVCRDGRRLEAIELELRDGEVVAARAEQGEAYLKAMLEIDPGARRLGELGLGLNKGIDRFTGSILFDEKIGGTVHLALGQSYPETGGVNTSALHWDLIVDTRTRGRIVADDRVVMEDGHWLVG
jgi:aminopeptidase